MKFKRPDSVFGPVPSHRLGCSLGADSVPFKTRSYDFIYCQLGHIPCKTVARKEWAPMDAVLHELKQKLTRKSDNITLSGSDEPTLHSRLGEITEHIQALTAVPVAVLTNGSLLRQRVVHAFMALAQAASWSLNRNACRNSIWQNKDNQSPGFVAMIRPRI